MKQNFNMGGQGNTNPVQLNKQVILSIHNCLFLRKLIHNIKSINVFFWHIL